MNKWHLLPQDWRENVDQRLEQILSQNRGLANEYHKAASKAREGSLEEFSEKLEKAWRKHNKYYNTLTTYATIVSRTRKFNPQELKTILTDMQTADKVTLAYSLAIKQVLEEEANKEGFEEKKPKRIFHIQYPHDHSKHREGTITTEELLKKYHANSPELFAQRKEKGVLRAVYKQGITPHVEERESQDPLEKILTIDNYDEYRHLYNLEGIEGFILKKVFSENATHKIEHHDYDYSDRIETPTTPGTIRVSVPRYTQHSSVSCLSAAYLIAENIMRGTTPKKSEELRLHEMIRSEHLPGAPFSKLARKLLEQRAPYDITILHDTQELFTNLEGLGEEGVLAGKEYEGHLREAERRGARREIARTGYLEMIGDRVQEDSLALIAVEHSSILHTALIHGREDDVYHVYDSAGILPRTITQESLAQYAKTSVGRWALLLSASNPTQDKTYHDSKAWFKEEERRLFA